MFNVYPNIAPGKTGNLMKINVNLFFAIHINNIQSSNAIFCVKKYGPLFIG